MRNRSSFHLSLFVERLLTGIHCSRLSETKNCFCKFYVSFYCRALNRRSRRNVLGDKSLMEEDRRRQQQEDNEEKQKQQQPVWTLTKWMEFFAVDEDKESDSD